MKITDVVTNGDSKGAMKSTTSVSNLSARSPRRVWGSAAATATFCVSVFILSGRMNVAAQGGTESAKVEWRATQQSIATGRAFSCAITVAGGVKCWGADGFGQLGNGATSGNSSTPVDAIGLSSGVTQISASSSHVCAVKGGKVFCWGFNFSGEIGTGATNNTGVETPYEVPGLTNVTEVSAGNGHTCVVDGGAVKCWGADQSGQLGDGGSGVSLTPVTAIASGAVAVDAKYGQTCALMADGSAKCWGKNLAGQVGNGSTVSPQSTPVTVTAVTGQIAALSVGQARACAIMKSDGALKCWGSNGVGGLGNGSNSGSFTGVTATGLSSGVAAVSANEDVSCALTTAGAVKCWGDNSSGQLGNGGTTNTDVPTDVPGLDSGVIAVTVSEYHVIAVMADGSLKSWGFNGSGQLGDGTTTDRSTPGVSVSGLKVVVPTTTTTTTAAPTTTASPTTTAAPTSTDKSRGDGGAEESGVGSLPETGSGSGALMVLSLGLMACGALLVARRRLIS